MSESKVKRPYVPYNNVEVDVDSTVRYLNRQFATKSRVLQRNSKELRTLQIEFCYLIDNVMRGYTFQRNRAIQLVNDFLTASFPAEEQPAQ
jgi:hypothetical protein